LGHLAVSVPSRKQLFAVTCGFHGNWAHEDSSVMYLLHGGNQLPSCRSVLWANIYREAEAHLINISRYENERPPGKENSPSIKIVLRDGLPWQSLTRLLLRQCLRFCPSSPSSTAGRQSSALVKSLAPAAAAFIDASPWPQVTYFSST